MQWIRYKLVWLFGLVLLTGSLLGANHYYNNGQRDGAAKKDPAPPADRPANRNATTGVNCTGVVAPENALIPLAPSAMGEVTDVFVKDDQHVKKGDKLLQIDDRQAKARLAGAEAQVKAAEGLVQDAITAGELYKERLKGQGAKIAGKKSELEAQKIKLARAEELVKSVGANASEVEATKKLIEGLEYGIKAEESVLKAYEIEKPDSKLKQAKANLEAAESQRDQAKLGVEACQMTAPADGTIMKVSVGVGAKFGQQIQQPAFWFYTGGLTIKAYVEPDYVSRVAEGQTATVYEQASRKGKSWTGKVTSIASSFQPKREATAIPDLLQQGQEPVLECRITLDGGQPLPRLNQKVHVHISGN